MKQIVAGGAVAAAVLIPSFGWAQPATPGEGRVAAKQSVYADDDETRIYTTLVDAQVALPADISIGAHGLVDVISTASVDVVSAATSKFDEVRIEAGGRAGIFFTPYVDFSAAFVHSQENDWQSLTPSGSLGVDLFRRNTRLTFGYGYSHNNVGRANDPNFEDNLDIHSAEIGLAQVVDASTLLNAAYTFQFLSGFQSSPYRYVTAESGFSVLEIHPSERHRHAFSLRALRLLAADFALEATYRLYFDGWGVVSNTATAGLRFDFADAINLRLRGRFYHQVAADFWRESYTEPMRYMSLDRELSTFWDAGGGIKIGYHNDIVRIDLKGDLVYYRFLDFARLSGRLAGITDVGVAFQW